MSLRALAPDVLIARKRTIIGRLINCCWFFFRGGIVLAVLGSLVGGWYYVTRFDEALRCQIQSRLAANYPQLQVSVRAAQRIDGEGIAVRGISLVEPGAEGPLAEVAYLDELVLACPTDLRNLLSGDLPIRQITLRRPTLRATRRPDGSWSVAKLLPLPHCDRQRPVLVIENGTLELFDPLRNPSATYTLRGVNLTFRPSQPVDAAHDRAAALGPLDFEGSLSGDFLHRAEVRGRYDPATGRFTLGGHVEQLDVGPDLYEALPTEVASRLRPCNSLRGCLDATFRVDADPARPVPYLFDVQGRLTRGRVEDARLPYPLTDVTLRVEVNNQGFHIDEASAHNGQTVLTLNCEGQGLDPVSRVSLRAEAERFPLDRQLVDALPPDLRQTWYDYLPAGEVNVRLALDFNGQRWLPRLEVECLDASFTHHKFPYRLEHVTGTMTYADEQLAFRLRGFGDNRPIELEGKVTRPGPAAVGTVTINAAQLPLTTKLMDALPGKSQALVRSLAPQGTITAQVDLWRQSPSEKWHQHVLVDLNRIAVKYEKFPYPLTDVRGRLEGSDGQWRFYDLVGLNDSAYVRCTGQFMPSPAGGELLLRFDATDVPLGEALRGALPPRMQALWLRTKPHGTINLTSQLRFAPPARKADVTVHVDLAGDGVTAEPDFFPFRIEKLRGSLDYSNGRVDFRQMTAEHGRTRVAAAGHCVFGVDGDWDLRIDNLTVDQLLADRDLVAALPPRLRKALGDLNFEGLLNLRGQLALRRGAAWEDPVKSQWDLELTTVQGHLRNGLELKNIAGGLRLTGEFDGTRQLTRGWIDLDSVTWNEYQLTEVRGPIWLGDDQILLGSWADPVPAGQPPHRATAKFFGGTLASDARVTLQGTPQFNVLADLSGADLSRFITETTHGATRLRGVVGANLQLTGSAAGMHRLDGSGSIQLRDGDIYELPLLLSLLKILSVRPPDTKAFSTSDINFRIRGDHMYFDRINFNGDAISLVGNGEMDFDKNVRMQFHAIVGPDKIQVPILRPVLGLASQQLMEISVEGPLDHPRTHREALPGVRRAVEQIQGEIEEPGRSKSATNSGGGLLPSLFPAQH